MQIIDLRSDTVTKPSKAMRRAMSDAEVGDDVFGEDPTVNRLEAMAAEITGKQAALFVTSGTMANLVSLMSHCSRGDEIILGDRSHIFCYEQGGSAAIGGIHPHTVPNELDGRLPLEEIEMAIRSDNLHFPRSRLVVLENTHNRCSGMPLTRAYLSDVRVLADRHQLKIHIDGARIFNAALAVKENVAALVREADSVSFCLSKGLAAPVGSVVCGDKSFIAKARRVRKVLGGGMRQAGVIAAAGVFALTEMVDRLQEDHDNARKLAQGLAVKQGIMIQTEYVQTNIVYINVDSTLMTAADLSTKLDRHGVKILPTASQQLRAVTHYGITAEDIDQTLSVFDRVLAR